MDDLKRMLERRADDMRMHHEAPRSLLRSARRRRVGTTLLAAALTIGLGTGTVVGIREIADGWGRATPQPGEATEDPRPAPIWPATSAEELDRHQASVDEGHQPWYRDDPEAVARVFAADTLRWTNVESRVLGPLTVAIRNTELHRDDVSIVVTMKRWRGRADGILVVTSATSEALALSSPVPGETVPRNGSITFSGRLWHVPEGGAVQIEANSPNGTAEAEFRARPRLHDELSVMEMRAPVIASVAVRDRDGNIVVYTAIPLGPVMESGVEPVPPPPGASETLPMAVFETKNAIVAAAYEADWERLEELIPEQGFTFTFGAEQDPVSFWQGFEGEGRTVLGILATLLELPQHAVVRDGYVWPEAAGEDPAEWDDADFRELRTIYSARQIEQFQESGAYFGWRVGINRDGTWMFFVQGD